MQLRVRMYRQGLGDCFLLTFSTGEASSHLLIDCGVLKGTPDSETKMRRVAENVVAETGGHLDRLVVTHEHWDHVSGFLQAESTFDTLTVGEVWLAWTEDEEDDVAQELRGRKDRALKAVAAAARQLAASDSSTARRAAARLNGLLDFHGDLGLDGRPTTAKALEWAKTRQNAQVRYLRPGDVLSGLPRMNGVRVYVLGPPHDRRLIKRSDPSKRHSEVYELAGDLSADLGFLAATDALAGDEPPLQPFEEWFRIGDPEARHEQFFAESYEAAGAAWRQIEHGWLGVAERLALQLDSDTNNTSLVLAFELDNGRVLLFPGDAQVGNWLSWELLRWTIEEGGGPRTVTSDDLLARTVLYKVGHHGSHNATPRERGLELMSSPELVAMIPVNRETAKKKDWNMPFPVLFNRLLEKTRGRILDADEGVRGDVAGASEEPGWLDYTIE